MTPSAKASNETEAKRRSSTTKDASSSSSSAAFHPRLSGVSSAFGPSLLRRVQTSKILLVGAGGIGCELLKNLALSGFRNVEVIDLDTVDVSNLNRQFLFRNKHVGMFKCEVAKDAALSMIPPDVATEGDEEDNKKGGKKISYVARRGNVCDESVLSVPRVSQFDLVLNALDNVAARRRVNRLCLAASVPLIEAGTTGYLGQTTVIHKADETECYECRPKPTRKVYPICTIRSTPTTPVHAIVWAKELHKLLFGEKAEESMLFESPEGDEVSTYMDDVAALRRVLLDRKEGETTPDPNEIRTKIKGVLSSLFSKEITKQIGTGRYETADKPPAPLESKFLEEGTDEATVAPTKRESHRSTDVWSVVECASETTSCLLDAFSLPVASLTRQFDKDDDLSMRFVTAAANLRSYNFGIEPIQSVYSAKGIAGNIIPAIATTNAIVAGLQVLEAFRVLKIKLENESLAVNGAEGTKKKKGLKDVCRYTYCNRTPNRRGYYLQPTSLPDPNPDCFVCRNATVPLSLRIPKWTLRTFLGRIVKKELGFDDPTIMLNTDVIYEEGEGSDEASYEVNLDKSLDGLPCGGVKHGTVMTVEDYSQDLTCEICFSDVQEWEKKGGEVEEEEEDEERFVVGGEKPRATAAPAASSSSSVPPERAEEKKADEGGGKDGDAARPPVPPAAAASTTGDGDGDDDVIEVMDDDDDDDEPPPKNGPSTTTAKAGKKKRARDDDDDDARGTERAENGSGGGGGGGGAPKKKKSRKETDDDGDDDVEIIELD